GYVLTGQTANRIACGSWANPENIVDPLLFIVTSDPSVFGQAQRCSAEASGTWIAMSLYLVALIVTVSLAVFGWLRYQQSDKAFIKEFAVVMVLLGVRKLGRLSGQEQPGSGPKKCDLR